jgi:hypothetical protein
VSQTEQGRTAGLACVPDARGMCAVGATSLSAMNPVIVLHAVVAMKVRLTRKHAEKIDGLDLRAHEPGDVLDLPPNDARLIVAEQWAIPERPEQESPSPTRRRADDFTQ